MTKQLSPEDLLDRMILCRGRALEADHKAMNYGATITGDRYAATAANWNIKADKAEAELREAIRQKSLQYEDLVGALSPLLEEFNSLEQASGFGYPPHKHMEISLSVFDILFIRATAAGEDP